MKSITQMKEEIAEIMTKLGDMKAQTEGEDREPTSEERGKAHDLLNRVDELNENIKLQERIQGTADNLATPKEAPTKPEVRETSVTQADQEKRDRFNSFGEQLQAVIHASHPSHRSVDPRLRETRVASGLNEVMVAF
jgi:chromosome segregation ATPase